MNIKGLNSTIALILGLSLFPSIASAHQIEVNYQLKSNALEIQSVFSTGEVFDAAKVVVYSPENPDQPWLETTTDQNGEFLFQPDPSITGNWAVEIGEDSHWDRLIIPVKQETIEVQKIARVEVDHPHEHYNLANQFLIGAIAVGGVMGLRILRQKFKP
jgi:nickel transport protein